MSAVLTDLGRGFLNLAASAGDNPTRTYRVRNIPQRYDEETIKVIIEAILSTKTLPCQIRLRSFATHAVHSQPRNHTATFNITGVVPALLHPPQNEWIIKEFDIGNQQLGETLIIDTHFEGFTVLWSPEGVDHDFDLVAISGLGSHAWGSFKQRGKSSMWLADDLHLSWPKARIMIYGYESAVMGTQSVQDLHDIAMVFKDRLVSIRESTKYSFKRIPLVFLGHSLGGLVVKQALVYLSRQRMPERATFLSTYAFLFFGVPCDGLAGERVGLAAMAEGQATQGFLSDLRLNSRTVITLAQEFRALFDPRPWVVILSFYETLKSPTAVKIRGITSMNGPHELWVSRVAAFNGRNTDQANDVSYCIPLPTDHSGLVKCEKWDTLDLILGKFARFDFDFAEDWIKKDWDDEAEGSTKVAPNAKVPGRKRTNEEMEQEVEHGRKLGIVIEAILNSLYFPEIFDRMDQIDPAHEKTFEWLLSPSMLADEVPGCQLLRWLNNDGPLFWISGKAGSGKSTLMKMLYEDGRMLENIRSWAKGNPVVTSSFFFSQKAESQIQKSREGLLRALLYQILTKRKDLVRRVFATQIEDERWIEGHTGAKNAWTWPELKQAFKMLAGGGLDDTRLCIFVDGLDEYRIDDKRDHDDYDDYGSNDAVGFEEDSAARARIKKIHAGHAEIAKLFRDISSFRNIKICVSSRPLNIFQDMFGNSADHLTLNQVTAEDIKFYVNNVLDNNPLMRRLTIQDPSECRRLVAEIVAKAEGVFLWVRLVVDILLEVLQDRGAISDLRVKLKELPLALGGPKGLYMSMLRDVKPELRLQGFRIFQILRITTLPVSALVLHFITGDSNAASKADEITSIGAEETSKWMIGRLRSCCGGLAETRKPERRERPKHSIDPHDMVQFMHLTVREFLDAHPPWGKSYSEATNHTDLYFLRACLFNLKLLRLPEHRTQPEGDPERDTFAWCWFNIHRALNYARPAELSCGVAVIDILDDLDITCQRIHNRLPGISRYVDGTSAIPGWHWAMEDISCTSRLNTALPMDNFFSLAINSQLYLYVMKKLETGVVRVDEKHGRPYLDYALNGHVGKPRFRGASDPNAFARRTSTLGYFPVNQVTPQTIGTSIPDALLFTPPPVLDNIEALDLTIERHSDSPPDLSWQSSENIPRIVLDRLSGGTLWTREGIATLLFKNGANPNQIWPPGTSSSFGGNTVWSRLLFNDIRTDLLIALIKLFVAHGASATQPVQFEIPYRVGSQEHTYIMSRTPYDILKKRLGESVCLVQSCGIMVDASSLDSLRNRNLNSGNINTVRRHIDRREVVKPRKSPKHLNPHPEPSGSSKSDQARVSPQQSGVNQTPIPREVGKKSSIFEKMKHSISKRMSR